MAWQKKRTTKKQKRTQNPAKRMVLRQVCIGIVLTLVVSGLLWGVWHVTLVPALNIQHIEATGGFTIKPETVVAVSETELAGTYYRLIPKRFVHLYPRQAIIERLLAIPRLQSVTVERKKQTLTISFTEYKPFALWCTDVEDSCVFIDSNGYSFAEAPQLRGGAFVRYISADTSVGVAKQGVPPAVLSTATAFVDTVAGTFGFRPQVVEFDDRDITYLLGGGGAIHTSRSDTVEQVLTNLETVLESTEFAHLEPGNFAYIDLRYGNKVFVQEELPEAATSTATTTLPTE